MTRDQRHLRLLSIFHYVVGGLGMLFACSPVFYLWAGLAFLLSPESFADEGERSPVLLGWFLVLFAGLFIIIGWVVAVLVIASGRCLARQKHYLFCFVMAGVVCAFMPFGTVLGVFTIIVLMRENVKGIFAVRGS